jgi:hypothetical protein
MKDVLHRRLCCSTVVSSDVPFHEQCIPCQQQTLTGKIAVSDLELMIGVNMDRSTTVLV